MDTGTVSIIVSVIAVGAALGIGLGRMIHNLRRDVDARINGLDARLRTVEASLARVLGLLEGLGFTGRAIATGRESGQRRLSTGGRRRHGAGGGT